MNTAFTPEPGALFYADNLRVGKQVVGFGDMATIVAHKDRSYSEVIFRALASDDRCVIAAYAFGGGYGSSKDSKKMLLRDEYRFLPVGPDVIKALGLEQQSA